MKYALFAGQIYYAEGGADDFVSYHDTLEDAQEALARVTDELARNNDAWGQIAEVATMEVVEFIRKNKPRGQ